MAVGSHISDTSHLLSERPATSIISEYEVSVFKNVEETVTAVPDIVCNNGLDIGDMVVEHNETEERIAWFLEGTCASCYIYCTLRSTQFIASMLQEACDECQQLTRGASALALQSGLDRIRTILSCTTETDRVRNALCGY